jgi:putative Mg2+ transporter-C (MgtC) family protein
MSIGDIILQTLVEEFSDLGDPQQVTQLTVRLLVAALLGGLLGLERERHRKPAGIRTHMLVAAGSALFVLVPLQMGMNEDGLSRVMQGLLAGVGFICAGSILKMEREEQVQGLTTAAGIWMTSAIGVAAGLGREMTAFLSALLVLGIMLLEGPLRRLGVRRDAGPET